MKSAFSSILCLLILSCSQSLVAQIAITDVLVKEPVPGQTVGAGYFSLANLGDTPRVLVAVSSDSADRVEMHSTTHHHGMMNMEEMESVDIPANAVLKFEPGKNHLMLFSPAEEALKSGSIELVFEFSDGETMTATASVEGWQ